MRNYALTFKTLAYKACVFVVFATALGLMLKLRLRGLVDAFLPLAQDCLSLVRSLFSNGTAGDIPQILNRHAHEFVEFVSGNVGSIVVTAVILIIGIFVYRYISGVSDCVSIIVLDGYASTLSKKPYFGVLFENLGRIAAFQGVEVLFACVYSLAVAALEYGVSILLLKFVPMLVPFACVAVTVLSHGLYNTMMSRFATECLIGKKKIGQAMKDGFHPEKGYFAKMFMSYSVISLINYYLFVTTFVFTFGVGTVLLIPLYANVIAGMRVIDRYVIDKRKYFIDYDNIVVPKELRENDEQLLKDVEI